MSGARFEWRHVWRSIRFFVDRVQNVSRFDTSRIRRASLEHIHEKPSPTVFGPIASESCVYCVLREQSTWPLGIKTCVAASELFEEILNSTFKSLSVDVQQLGRTSIEDLCPLGVVDIGDIEMVLQYALTNRLEYFLPLCLIQTHSVPCDCNAGEFTGPSYLNPAQ